MNLVTFVFDDEPDVLAAAKDGENVLTVAKRAGIVLDHPCDGIGSCGKCLVQVLSGELDATHSFRLSEADWEDNWRLACLSRVHGDVHLRVKEL